MYGFNTIPIKIPVNLKKKKETNKLNFKFQNAQGLEQLKQKYLFFEKQKQSWRAKTPDPMNCGMVIIKLP